ncbi:hypothetical protein [Nocardia sp. NPDC057353]|uniref:hypothetical protein n=1 Tax=Nocardia sp. NPDC057353 TaxID=3346104 RepID=UPI0036341207
MRTPPIGDITGYLRATGWTSTGQWRGAEVWSRDEFDVLVPPAGEVPDTAARVRELTRCVADAERRTPAAVWRDLGRVRFDVVGYRGAERTASVPAGVRAVQAMRDLLAHSAREALGDDGAADAVLGRTRIAFGSDGSPDADLGTRIAPHADGSPDDRSDGARIALDDNGSAGARPDRAQPTFDGDAFGLDLVLPADDGGRTTGLRLLRTCTAVRRAAESGLAPDGIPEPVALAVADLAGTDRAGTFELTFRWSPLNPRPRAVVTFPAGAGARIHAAATLGESATAVVTGPVTGLFDDEEGERRLIRVRGVLELDGTATGRRRTVPVRLPTDADYERALAAHRDGSAVRAEGAPTDGRTRGIAAAPGGFTVLDHPAP